MLQIRPKTCNPLRNEPNLLLQDRQHLKKMTHGSNLESDHTEISTCEKLRLGVTKHEIFRLEKAEQESRIVLANLRRGAIALGCELVYALVPREGSLEDLSAAEKAAREAACTMARNEEEKKVKRVEEWIDWRGAVRRKLRKDLRKMGLRVR